MRELPVVLQIIVSLADEYDRPGLRDLLREACTLVKPYIGSKSINVAESACCLRGAIEAMLDTDEWLTAEESEAQDADPSRDKLPATDRIIDALKRLFEGDSLTV